MSETTTPLRQYLRVTVASPGLFHSRVVVPHVFTFVLLLAAGSLLGDSLAEVVHRCVAVVYLIASGIALRRLLPRVSLRVYLSHMVGVILFIQATAVGLRLDLLLSSYLPIACMVAVAPLLPLPRSVVAVAAGAIGAALAVALGIDAIFSKGAPGEAPDTLIAAYLLSVCWLSATVIWVARSRVVELDTGRKLGGPLRPTREGIGGDSEAGTLATSDDQLAFQRAQRFYVRELRGQFTTRVALLGLWTVFLIVLLFRMDVLQIWPHALLLGVVAILEGVGVRSMRRARHDRDFFLTAALIALTHSAAWAIPVSHLGSSSPLSMLLLGSAAIGYLSLPWPGSLHLLLAAWYGGLMAIDVIFGNDVAGQVALYSTAVVLATLIGRWTYRLRMVQLGAKLMRLAAEGAPPPTIMIRLVAWILSHLFDTRRALLIRADPKGEGLEGSHEAEVVTDSTVIPSSVDRLFVRGMIQRLLDQSVRSDPEGRRRAIFDSGVLPFASLGEQFVVPLLSWFSSVPRAFCFAQLRAPFGEREVPFFVVVPLSRWASTSWLVGDHRRMLEMVREVLAIPRFYLLSTLHRLQSADELLASEQTASQRDEELNQVVHLVNNAAQEISSRCETLRSEVREDASRGSEEGGVPKIIDEIEGVSRALSHGVSDVRLIREMAMVPVRDELEIAPVEELIESVSPYVEYHCRRRGVAWKSEPWNHPELAIRVVHRDLAAVAVRTACLLILGRLSRGHKLELRVQARERAIRVMLCHDGPRGYEGATLTSAFTGSEADPLMRARVQALERFVSASEGSVTFERETDWLSHRVVFTFSLARVVNQKRELPSSRWIMLVDDNPQVTMFYATVAEALSLPYRIADSFSGACALLEEGGQPQLVVTDVQLGDGSGLDLVRRVRERFNGAVPVIVVTGESVAPAVLAESSAGKETPTRVLMKPVGRRRLFVEIQELLSQPGEKGGAHGGV